MEKDSFIPRRRLAASPVTNVTSYNRSSACGWRSNVLGGNLYATQGGDFYASNRYVIADRTMVLTEAQMTLEKHDKTTQATAYGRACMLYSRSVELLDLVGIYPRIADIGFMVRYEPLSVVLFE